MKDKGLKLLPCIGLGMVIGSLAGELPFKNLLIFTIGLGILVRGILESKHNAPEEKEK